MITDDKAAASSTTVKLATLDSRQLVVLGVLVALLAVVALVGSQRLDAWAAPVDFVEVCSEVPGTTSSATDGFDVRIAALDSMIACTEQMEVVYVGMAKTASGISLSLYVLLTAAASSLLVFVGRWWRERSAERAREPWATN